MIGWLAAMVRTGTNTAQFREGSRAFSESKSYESCPYQEGINRLRWQDGWLAAGDDAAGTDLDPTLGD